MTLMVDDEMELVEKVLERPKVVNAIWVGMLLVTKAGLGISGCHCAKTGP